MVIIWNIVLSSLNTKARISFFKIQKNQPLHPLRDVEIATKRKQMKIIKWNSLKYAYYANTIKELFLFYYYHFDESFILFLYRKSDPLFVTNNVIPK